MLRTPRPRPRSRCRRGSSPSTCAATASSGDPCPAGFLTPPKWRIPSVHLFLLVDDDHAGKKIKRDNKVQSTCSAISTNRIRSRTFKNTNFTQSNSNVPIKNIFEFEYPSAIAHQVLRTNCSNLHSPGHHKSIDRDRNCIRRSSRNATLHLGPQEPNQNITKKPDNSETTYTSSRKKGEQRVDSQSQKLKRGSADPTQQNSSMKRERTSPPPQPRAPRGRRCQLREPDRRPTRPGNQAPPRKTRASFSLSSPPARPRSSSSSSARDTKRDPYARGHVSTAVASEILLHVYTTTPPARPHGALLKPPVCLLVGQAGRATERERASRVRFRNGGFPETPAVLVVVQASVHCMSVYCLVLHTATAGRL
jgi:hypothetical protein